MPNELEQLKEQEYEARLEVDRLRRELFGQSDPTAVGEAIFDELEAAEEAYRAAQEQRAAAEAANPNAGLIMRAKKGAPGTLGAGTTGLAATVHLRMAEVPTAICHLLDAEENELVSAVVKFDTRIGDSRFRRVRVTSYVEGYSAKAVETAELKLNEAHEFKQLPTFFPAQLAAVNELTRATLNVQIEDLDGGIELHATQPIWLLARTTAPLSVKDPKTGERTDLTHYLGAFVTPNAQSLMTFLRLAAEAHPDGRLSGYQGDPSKVEPQVEALFTALKHSAGITYVNSLVDFNPDELTSSQRVRLPRESLADKEANCIDGTVLFASLLEGISMNPAIVLVPGHAFVAWESWNKDPKAWRYLETTMIGSSTFEEARRSGDAQARKYQKLAEDKDDPRYFRRLALKDLRVGKGITPME